MLFRSGRIVPLDTKLHSGDQVEIITSKNQHPNKNWIKFVKTHKAKSAIRKWLNREEEKIVDTGKDMWEKKIKKLKLSFDSQDISKLVQSLKFENNRDFFQAIAKGNIDLDQALIPQKENVVVEDKNELEFEKFVDIARKDAGDILVDGSKARILYSYAKCCNPIPGDPVIGYVTVGEGIKVHRKTCHNLLNLAKSDSSKLINVQWPQEEGNLFVAGLTVRGDDSPGILNDIAHAIVSYKNTNIKSINISTNDSTFEGNVTVYVANLEHLISLIGRLKKVKGVYSVERFESN